MLRFLCIFILVLGPACKRKTSSQVSHDLGRSQNNDSGLQWYDTSDAEYFAATGAKSEDAYPNDHVAVRRIQYWADAMDAMLRKRDAKRMISIPKPKIKLIRSDMPNAFVTAINRCLDLELVVAGSETSFTADALNFSRDRGSFQELPSESGKCVGKTFAKQEQQQLITWLFAPYPNCSAFKLTESSLILPESCVGKDYPGARRARKLVVAVISNQVTVFDSYFKTHSEEELVSVLAHELGHYYMAHGITPSSSYNFFYKLGTENPGQKPVAVAEADALGKRLQKLLAIYPRWTVEVPGQRYHSALFPIVQGVASRFDTDSCQSSEPACMPCKAVQAFMSQSNIMTIFNGFPMKALTEDEEKASYKKFEQLGQACLVATQRPEFYVKLIEVLLGQQKDMLAELKPWPQTTNMDEFLVSLTASINRIKERVLKEKPVLMKEAAGYNLGFYTDEQEADELEMEWLHEIGINPSIGVNETLKSMKIIEKFMPRSSDELSSAECESLYKNNWRDSQGNPFMVPVGLWDDPHHTECYRAFNMDREIRTHKLTQESLKPKPPRQCPSWGSIAQLVTQDIDSRSTPREEPAEASRVTGASSSSAGH